MEKLKKWMKVATTAEQEDLATFGGTTRHYLYQLSSGQRLCGSELAGNLEFAAENIRKRSKGRLPRLTRADLSPVCAKCKYAEKCIRKNRE